MKGLIAPDVRREETEIGGGDVWCHGRHDVEPVRTKSGTQVADDYSHPVSACPEGSVLVHVDGDNRCGRHGPHEVDGNGARPRAQVDGACVVATGGKQLGATTGQLLGLEARHIDAGAHLQAVTPEGRRPGDPRQGLALLASTDEGIQSARVGGGLDELPAFLLGCHASSGRQAVDEVAIGADTAGRQGVSTRRPSTWWRHSVQHMSIMQPSSPPTRHRW